MNRLLLSLLVLSYCTQAASLQKDKIVEQVLHVGHEFRIEGSLVASTKHDGLTRAARQIPALLSVKLSGHMSGAVARERVMGALHEYEMRMIMQDEVCAKGWKISSIALKIVLEKSGARLNIQGEADPATFSTFLPPYTVQSEDTLNEVPGMAKAFEILKKRDAHPIPEPRGLFPDGVLHVGDCLTTLDNSALFTEFMYLDPLNRPTEYPR